MRSVIRPVVFAALVLVAGQCFAQAVLDESGYLRRYLRFDASQYSPTALKAEGLAVLGEQRMDKLKKETEKEIAKRGVAPASANWMDYVYHPMHANFSRVPAPLPPDNWAGVDCDDASWVCQRYPFQGGRAVDITQLNYGQFDETMDTGLQSAFYRARFVVEDPAKAGRLTLSAVYSGGIRLLINGREVDRGNLPAGPLTASSAGSDYPVDAYKPGGEKLRERHIGPISIDAGLLRAGVNVLAIEIRASRFHPIVQANPTQPNWGGPMRPWPHAKLIKLELGPASAAVPSMIVRPAGVQAWVSDENRHLESTDFLPAGESPGTIRIVGARNGTYGAQIAVGSDRPLAVIRVIPEDLKQMAGAGQLAASAITVSSMLPYPADGWDLRHLGDERGLDAKFPDNATLAQYAGLGQGKLYLFDQLTARPADSLPANMSRPFWLSLRIPAGAAPGTYRGHVAITADGWAGVKIPMEVEVIDWRLPDPKDFQTFVGCEENAYGVAKQYGVPLWSDDHFRLIESSFKQLGRIGNKWLNIPVIARSEYGNKADSMVRWVRTKDGQWKFDFTVMDRYLDLAIKHCGTPRVINVVVMQGMKGQTGGQQVMVYDEASGQGSAMDLLASPGRTEARQAWTAFGKSLYQHMKSRGLEKAMCWGYPLETEVDPDLKNVLLQAVPEVGWAVGPHEMMYNATYVKDARFFKVITTIRYNGGWPAFRMDQGWKSQTTHLLSPRVGGTVFALHTTSEPFAYRVLPDHALALGRNGFCRVGADEWAAIHHDGMVPAQWQTGIPVLFVLWPGPAGAESSARFECLLEGIQETEGRIFLEQAVDRGAVSGPLAVKIRKTLSENLDETRFFLGNSMLRAFEEYSYNWQERSRRVYELATEVAKAQGVARP